MWLTRCWPWGVIPSDPEAGTQADTDPPMRAMRGWNAAQPNHCRIALNCLQGSSDDSHPHAVRVVPSWVPAPTNGSTAVDPLFVGYRTGLGLDTNLADSLKNHVLLYTSPINSAQDSQSTTRRAELKGGSREANRLGGYKVPQKLVHIVHNALFLALGCVHVCSDPLPLFSGKPSVSTRWLCFAHLLAGNDAWHYAAADLVVRTQALGTDTAQLSICRQAPGRRETASSCANRLQL